MEDSFSRRHIGPRDHDVEQMLKVSNVNSVKELIDQTVPYIFI